MTGVNDAQDAEVSPELIDNWLGEQVTYMEETSCDQCLRNVGALRCSSASCAHDRIHVRAAASIVQHLWFVDGPHLWFHKS